MDKLCNSPLWDPRLSWYNEDEPDLSPCFQETVLIWLPAVLLFIFGTVEVVFIFRRPIKNRIPLSVLGGFRSFLTILLVILSLGELLDTIFVGLRQEHQLADLIGTVVKLIAYIFALALIQFYRSRGIQTSGILFTFWLLTALASAINLRSLIRWLLRDNQSGLIAEWNITNTKFYLRLTMTPIALIQFVLACIADKKIKAWTEDDSEFEGLRECPENSASVFSWLTFAWLDSLISLGYKKSLTQSDLYALDLENRAEILCKDFDRIIGRDVKRALDARRDRIDEIARQASSKNLSMSNPLSRTKDPIDIELELDKDKDARYVNIIKVIALSFWPRLILGIVLRLIETASTFASPLILSRVISFISDDEPRWRGILYAIGLFFASLIEALADNQESKVTNLNVVRARTCITAALYRKTLRLSHRGKRDSTTGQIVNLMSLDAQRVADFIQNINTVTATPILLIISLVLLYQQLGPATFAGLIVMVINIPFNAFVTFNIRKLQKIVMSVKDRRIKLLSEIFNGIKIIKIYAWEDSFKKRTEDFRAEEVRYLKRQTRYTAAISFAYQCLPFVVILSSFATFVLIDIGNVLTVNRIFVSLSLFNIIRTSVANLPVAITNLSLSLIAFKRLNKFFERDEIDPDSIKQIEDRERSAIRIVNADFRWDSENEFSLTDINLTIPRGKLVAIVGLVGSGKSSLLSAMLGDLEIQRGRVEVDLKSSMAYVPQEAWVLNDTIKNNVKLSSPFDEDKYSQVLEACALIEDLKTLPQGDCSEIGERGLNLSGGQKQRVSLARAVYADRDIYLFDDPLSAVDAHVGRHIFDRIIGPGGLLADRTRVLVTNKLSILPDCDYIAVMNQGKISETGTYEQLLLDRGIFSQLLLKYITENSSDVKIDENSRLEIINKELKRLKEAQESKKRDEASSKDQDESKSTSTKTRKTNGNINGNGGNLTGRETVAVGSIGWRVHLNFAKTMGITFMLSIVLYLASSFFTIGSSLWLSAWSNDSFDERLSRDSYQRNIRLGVYATLGLLEAVFVVGGGTLLNFSCLSASKILHNQMLARILQAPLAWYNMTPSGRIINRFSKDIDTIDVTIRFNVRLFLIMSLRSLTSVILVSLGSAYSILLIMPVILIYVLLQLFYIPTSRQLKRIESTMRSPIFTHFGESIAGMSSIRAFGLGEQFNDEMNRRLNMSNASYYMSFTTTRWLTVRLKFLGLIIVLVAALAAVLSRGLISPGIAGLSVTYSLTITTALNFLVRAYSDYETNVVSVERLIEYTKLPIEAQSQEIPSDHNWPSKGRVVFDNYCARYRPNLDLVIKDFSLDVGESENVGLVGRTGAGKSSIILSIFRIFEPAGGQIIIDDIDISKINLNYLRSRLSIIPQEPVLFTGTVRDNVDPINNHTDEEIWAAIDLAHLGSFIRSLPGGLEHEVSEGGGNFSIGQRQLVCLARALLRKSKILLLDEATAAVDMETDNLIQQTIRKEFKSQTIITIAHRLETILDYDRVVVMDQGRLAEVDKPGKLLKRPSSMFYGLAKEAGIVK